MHHEIVISGFGGQGALFAGQLIAYAAMEEGRHVTWIPSYGPEMRGGTANCTVIVSDEEIGSPLVRQPTAAVVLNPPSYYKYEPLVQDGGVLIMNSSLISATPQRSTMRTLGVPANELAAEMGIGQLANVIMLGALVAATQVVKLETLDAVLEKHVSARHRDKLGANEQALRRGASLADGSG